MNENPPKLNREQAINVAIQKIVAAPKAKVVFIIEHEQGGVEMIHTDDSYSWLLGVIRGVEILVETAYVERVRESVSHASQVEQQAAVVKMAEDQDKEKLN